MTGSRDMVIKLYLKCSSCDLDMKLDGDVEHDVGEFVCGRCGARVTVSFTGSN